MGFDGRVLVSLKKKKKGHILVYSCKNKQYMRIQEAFGN